VDREREQVRARELRVNQIIDHNALRWAAGPQPFWHRAPDGITLHRLDLPLKLAQGLRLGTLAVAWSDVLGEPSYRVLPREHAERVASILAARVLFLNEAPPDVDDPAEQLLERSWEPTPAGG